MKEQKKIFKKREKNRKTSTPQIWSLFILSLDCRPHSKRQSVLQCITEAYHDFWNLLGRTHGVECRVMGDLKKGWVICKHKVWEIQFKGTDPPHRRFKKSAETFLGQSFHELVIQLSTGMPELLQNASVLQAY